MAYLKDYKHDIFISYCHSDNLKQFDEPLGWVENFYQNLRPSLVKLMGSKKLTIWWDEKGLDGNTLFDDTIADALKHSAILICLNSPSYLNSEYCKKELDLFHKHYKDKTPGINIGNRSRILNVLLYNIPYTEWPPEFGGAAGFPFHDAVEEDEKGHPFTFNDGKFKNTFLDFCDSVSKLIEEFHELIEKPEPLPPPVFDIFFGEVSDSLRNTRKRTIAELKKQNIEIIPDIPPPFEKDKHEAAVNEKLENAELSVHLLDQFPGKNIDGEDALWYPQKQAELSLLTSKPKFIWVPADLNIETIEEETYRTFLRDLENGNLPATGIKYVRGSKSEVTQQVIDMAKNMQPKSDGQVSVLLDTHYNDQLYAWELYKGLLENEIQPFINPQEGDPKKNVNMLEERIRQVRKLIFFYGKISHEWVIERMKAAVQLVVENNYPIKEFFVLMLPPHKDPGQLILEQKAIRINVINNSDTPQLDPNVLQQFFKSIKAVS